MRNIINIKVEAIERMLKAFKAERIMYLVATGISLGILIYCAITLTFKPDKNYEAIFGLFGSTGVISYSASRLLKMWSDAIKFLSEKIEENGKDK